MIKLGDKVKCKYSGFIGIAVARTEFINGCVQYSVVPKVAKDNKITEDISIDEESLVVVKSRKKKPEQKPTGGRTKKAISIRGF